MKESEGFALNMRMYRSLVFKWSKDESNKELRDKVYDIESRIIKSLYPDQDPIGFHVTTKKETT